jgi:hypothetical protein
MGLAAVAGVGGCSGSLGSAKSDGSADRHDGSADRRDDAVCSPLDVATQCSGALTECQPTWTEVLVHPECTVPYGVQESRGDCGPYHIRQISFPDGGGSTDYYDIASGELVAVYGRTGCYGPPGGLPDLADCPALSNVCGDGGVGRACICTNEGGGPGCLPVDPSIFAWNSPCPGDGGARCFASCEVNGEQYYGCVMGGSVATECLESCEICP